MRVPNTSAKPTQGAATSSNLEDQQLFKTGKLDDISVQRIITNLTPKASLQKDKDAHLSRVTILHVLRWADGQHKTTKFQTWYVYDPDKQYSWSYISTGSRLSGSFVDGKKNFRLIYVHLNFSLTDPNESITTSPATGEDHLVHPIGYKINIQKQPPELQTEALTVLQIIGAVGAQSNDNPLIGYYSVFDFDSAFTNSTITVSATLLDPSTAKTNGTSSDTGKTAANSLASQQYTNQPLQWIGLGFAVPLKSYRDLQYQQSGSTIQPTTINRQNVYLTVSAYVPPVEAKNLALRWLPHPFFGVPIKGQPLKQTMVGVGAGYKWLEPFWGIVFDEQSIKASGMNEIQTHWVRKGVYGINISVTAAAKSLISKKGS